MEEKKYSSKEIIEWMELYGKIQQEREVDHFSYPMTKPTSKKVLELIPIYREKVPEEIRIALDSSDELNMDINNLEKRCQTIANYKSICEWIFKYFERKYSSKKS